MMSISIPDDQLNQAVLVAVKKLDLIFKRYPEVTDENGGWAINPTGREPGMRGTYVKFEQMKKWLNGHTDEIDWYERLAK